MATSVIFTSVYDEISLPVTGSQSISQGDLVLLGPGGYATKTLAASRPFMGVAKADADNSAGSAGAINVTCVIGTFEKSASFAPTKADIGKTLYISNTTGALAIVSGANANIAGVMRRLGTNSSYVVCDMIADRKLTNE